jgi:hypothetical protein
MSMINDSTITLASVLIKLREMLIQARKNHDIAGLTRLMNTFGMLEEVVCTSEPKAICGILVHLRDSARDSLMGVDFKSEIPTIEEIKAALSPP